MNFSHNQLIGFDVSGLSIYYLNCSYNYMEAPYAVGGFHSSAWDGDDFIFYPQRTVNSISVLLSPSNLAVPQTITVETSATATIYDQFGVAMAGKNVAWSLVGAPISGVNIISATGIITVDHTATPDTTVTVKATCGSVSGTAELTLVEPVPTTVEVTPTIDCIPILNPYNATVVYATVYDQNGEEMENSRYERSFGDLPIQGKKVEIVIDNRKMLCGNKECPYKTFAETFACLPFKGKRSTRLTDEIVRISMEMSSVSAAAMMQKGIAKIGKSTICNLLKKSGAKN